MAIADSECGGSAVRISASDALAALATIVARASPPPLLPAATAGVLCTVDFSTFLTTPVEGLPEPLDVSAAV